MKYKILCLGTFCDLSKHEFKSFNKFLISHRWSPEEIGKGRLWEVYNIQGQQRTWFVGSSVLHESTRAVVEYINLLFRNMIPHDEFYSKKK